MPTQLGVDAGTDEAWELMLNLIRKVFPTMEYHADMQVLVIIVPIQGKFVTVSQTVTSFKLSFNHRNAMDPNCERLIRFSAMDLVNTFAECIMEYKDET